MPKNEDIGHSLLVISASEQFDAIVKKSLKPGKFLTSEFIKNASLARRNLLERYYDMVIINAPLPDENGVEIALDATEKCSASVLIIVPKDVYSHVADSVVDYGVLVMSKPFSYAGIDNAVRFLTASSERILKLRREAEKKDEKMEELRIVGKVKCLLVERKNMTEDEAHRHIGKLAMDNCISRGRAAKRLLDEME